jgi:hypothetical protein
MNKETGKTIRFVAECMVVSLILYGLWSLLMTTVPASQR